MYGFGESEIRWRAKTIKLEMETTRIYLDVDVSMYTISLYTSFSKFNRSNSEAFEALEVAFASRKTVGSCCACQVMSYVYGLKMLQFFVSDHFHRNFVNYSREDFMFNFGHTFFRNQFRQHKDKEKLDNIILL